MVINERIKDAGYVYTINKKFGGKGGDGGFSPKAPKDQCSNISPSFSSGYRKKQSNIPLTEKEKEMIINERIRYVHFWLHNT